MTTIRHKLNFTAIVGGVLIRVRLEDSLKPINHRLDGFEVKASRHVRVVVRVRLGSFENMVTEV